MSNEETVSVLISEGANQTVALSTPAPVHNKTKRILLVGLSLILVAAATVAGLLAGGFIGGKSDAPPMNNQVDDSINLEEQDVPVALMAVSSTSGDANEVKADPLYGSKWGGDVELGFPEAIAERNWLFNGVWDEKVLGPKPRRGSRMLGARSKRRHWPGNVMIYSWGNLSPLMKKVAKNAMREIELNSCFRFKERTNEQTGYVKFVNGNGCSANVGYYASSVTKITLSPTNELNAGGCDYGAVIHELMHALGFWHTQSRTDRDKYVTIKLENVQSGHEHNFDKLKEMALGDNAKGKEYDYDSIMHYARNAFGKGGFLGLGRSTTIEAPRPIGNRRRLSERDVIQLNEHGGCAIPSRIPATITRPRGQVYSRGIGRVPTACPDGQERSGLLCYPKCRSGYSSFGPTCVKSFWTWYGRGWGESPTCSGSRWTRACATPRAMFTTRALQICVTGKVVALGQRGPTNILSSATDEKPCTNRK